MSVPPLLARVTYADVIIPLSVQRPDLRLLWSFCKSVNRNTISPASIILYPSKLSGKRPSVVFIFFLITFP